MKRNHRTAIFGVILLVGIYAGKSFAEDPCALSWIPPLANNSARAQQERYLLKWQPSTNPIAGTILERADPTLAPSGGWIAGFGAPDLADALLIEQIESSLYLVSYWHTECSLMYHLDRHATYTNGILVLERPIGDWNEAYDQLIAVRWDGRELLVPRRVAEGTFVASLGTNSVMQMLILEGFSRASPGRQQ